MTGKQKRMLRLGIIVVLVVSLCLTGVVVLKIHLQSPSKSMAATVANGGGTALTPILTDENIHVHYTFEDGGTDGWIGMGHVNSVANSTTQAHDGTHSLQMILDSSSSSDLPAVLVPISSGGPETGQMLTTYLYVTGSTKVEARLFIQDSKYTLHTGNSVSLASGRWTELSLTIPSLGGSVMALGVQFLVTPIHTNAAVYLDSVGWGTASSSTPTPVVTTSGGSSGSSTPAPVATSSGRGSGSPTPAATPIPTSKSAPGGNYTFENGGLDGWSSNGHVVSLTNGTAYAHDGAHSLQIALYSSSSSDLPSVYVPVSSGGPVTGETLTAYLYLPGSSVSVSAKLYVQDSKYQWYYDSLISLAHGQWVELSLTVPRVSGSLTALGVQFLAKPANTNATVYLDTVNW